MLAVYLSPLYLIVNLVLIFLILRWLKAMHPFFQKKAVQIVFIILYLLLILTPLPAAFGDGALQSISRIIFNHWLGILLYLIITLILLYVGTLIYRIVKKIPLLQEFSTRTLQIRGLIILISVAMITAAGTANAYHIKTKSYDVTINKSAKTDSLKIALLADLHIGANVGVSHLQHMKSVIDQIHPDLVVYAGDIFDNDFDAIEDPEAVAEILGSISAACKSYACWGNHDIDETILAGFTFASKNKEDVDSDPRMDALLEQAGITLLEDETVLIDDSYYLTGRIDASSKEKSNLIRKTPAELTSGLDHDKPIIVIDHQPKELQELSDAGVDLTLSGHTHNGQNFPGNLTIKLMWENPCGMISVNNMTDIVTSGVGIWGPAMRVGTDSEVVAVNVTFAGQ